MTDMRHLASAFVITAALSTPLVAQASDEDGFSLMEEGARLFMQGILREIEPALDEMEEFARELEPGLRDFAETMGPALKDMLDKVDDWTMYHPPEVLENGDIIIRRKTPSDEETAPENEIEL